MAYLPRKRLRDREVELCKAPEGIKRRVYLDMIHLINLAMDETKGPEMHVRIAHCDRGFKRVSINFDASKLPFNIKFGVPEQGVLFIGSKFLSVEDAKHDALMKVALYLRSKFGVHIIDWSYEKFCLAEKTCLEHVNSIEEIVGNIKSIVGNWRASLDILKKEHRAFSVNPNPLYLAIFGKLINVKSHAEAFLEHISEQMMVTSNEHVHFCKNTLSSSTESVVTIKIPETDIIRDIVLSLGGKAPKFSNRLVGNDMFRGECKIYFDDSWTSKPFGKTIIEGDVKNSPYEAQCSAASKAIQYLQCIGIEVVDLNFPGLREKNEMLDFLQCIKAKYVAIEHHVAAEWRSIITEIKGMVNSEYTGCKDMGLDVDEYDKIECSQMLEESIGDITTLFHLCTMGLEP